MIRILVFYGTRPEAIKMAPVIRALRSRPAAFECIACSTGQHREMVQQVEETFQIRPDEELGVMTASQRLTDLLSRLLASMSQVVQKHSPDWILAQGDTTTVLAAALCAFQEQIAFGHVEAGLRTGNLKAPFPEEFNRIVADLAASECFCPTERSAANLRDGGICHERIHVTGNTVIDALQYVSELPFDWPHSPLARVSTAAPIVMVTAHRRESFGATFRGICESIRELAVRFPGHQFVYPVHLNPNVRNPVNAILSNQSNVFLLPPLDYVTLVNLMKHSELVMTDSGGIQEEAPGLRIPVVVMRETTERPEGVESGVVRLAGTSQHSIVGTVSGLLENVADREAMRTGVNPYGDGRAGSRIAQWIQDRSK